MVSTDSTRTFNSIVIDAPVVQVWPYVATAQGWNAFLSDVAKVKPATDPVRQAYDEFEPNDKVTFVIGELKNEAVCTEVQKFALLSLREKYASVLPDGNWWKYELRTTFSCTEKEGMTTVSVAVTGYSEEEMMQWIRECGEMGWRQSLFNLKCVIELGLDLRNEIFNYPRLGVLNYSATAEQVKKQGLPANVQGNFLKKIYPGGPAEQAGLCSGDIITHMNEELVPTYADFVRALSRCYGKKDKMKVRFYREGVLCNTMVDLTYDDRFTGMIDPEMKPLELVARERKNKSRHR